MGIPDRPTAPSDTAVHVHPLGVLVILGCGLVYFVIGAVAYLAFRNHDGTREATRFGRLELFCRRIRTSWARAGDVDDLDSRRRVFVFVSIAFMAVGIFIDVFVGGYALAHL